MCSTATICNACHASCDCFCFVCVCVLSVRVCVCVLCWLTGAEEETAVMCIMPLWFCMLCTASLWLACANVSADGLGLLAGNVDALHHRPDLDLATATLTC